MLKNTDRCINHVKAGDDMIISFNAINIFQRRLSVDRSIGRHDKCASTYKINKLKDNTRYLNCIIIVVANREAKRDLLLSICKTNS